MPFAQTILKNTNVIHTIGRRAAFHNGCGLRRAFYHKNQTTKKSEVERLLSCLDARQRELVQKCVIEGWTYAEIAAREGKDESAVRHAVKRALKKIKKILF